MDKHDYNLLCAVLVWSFEAFEHILENFVSSCMIANLLYAWHVRKSFPFRAHEESLYFSPAENKRVVVAFFLLD